MKIAIYTALYGEKDILRPPLNYEADSQIDYYLFTDKVSHDTSPYVTVIRPAKFKDVAKNARYYKILGDLILKEYELLIWHDANIQLCHNQIRNLTSLASNTFLTTFVHPNRDDFYSETMTCIRVEKDFSLRLLYQAVVYFINGMPAHQGMCSTGILIKNFKYPANKVLEFWWKQTLAYSRRDQLSLAYTIYKQKPDITLINKDILNNNFSRYHNHNHTFYEEKIKFMDYNYWVFKKISFLGVKLMRKIKKNYK